jgi:hypothetical protein
MQALAGWRAAYSGRFAHTHHWHHWRPEWIQRALLEANPPLHLSLERIAEELKLAHGARQTKSYSESNDAGRGDSGLYTDESGNTDYEHTAGTDFNVDYIVAPDGITYCKKKPKTWLPWSQWSAMAAGTRNLGRYWGRIVVLDTEAERRSLRRLEMMGRRAYAAWLLARKSTYPPLENETTASWEPRRNSFYDIAYPAERLPGGWR